MNLDLRLKIEFTKFWRHLNTYNSQSYGNEWALPEEVKEIDTPEKRP